MRVYPKVFRAGKKARIYYVPRTAAEKVEIRIFGMERYSLPRTERMRIDEEVRHPFMPMEKVGDALYAIDYTFPTEQRYTFRVVEDGNHGGYGSFYAVEDDLFDLGFYKGDTHLHSCRSDGVGEPLSVAIAYRRAGFDFMCLTDHHRYAPSLEARDAVLPLTDAFTVFPGEEVHNKDMGYVHIVNFGGRASVNDIIENDPDYVKERLAAIREAVTLPEDVDAATTLMRLFITDEIRRAGGLAVLAHPYWNTGGEYSMESAEMVYHLKNGSFDALELLASDDHDGNGDNLQVALYYALRDEGVRTPILGASDRHDPEKPTSLFNRHFSLVFAESAAAIPDAVRRGMSVAVNRRSDDDFFVFGDYRLVKYTRFLLSEFYPHYATLTAAHADALAAANGTRTEAIAAAEAEINAFRAQFFTE